MKRIAIDDVLEAVVSRLGDRPVHA
jgi:hypothetical protein